MELLFSLSDYSFFYSNRGIISEKMEDIDISERVVQQHVQFFSPASYNLPHFKYKHLPASEVRNAWNMWIRWFENVMAAANVLEGPARKMQLLAMGGIELQCAYYGLPGAEDETNDDPNAYLNAKTSLTQHFSPKHHESFERFLFWSLAPEDDEPIEKFSLRVQQKAEKICFGKTANESRHIAIIDKIIQYATDDLRQKLLEKEVLTLDDTTKIVNAHQAVRYQSSKMNSSRGDCRAASNVNHLVTKNSSTDDGKPKCFRSGYRAHQPGDRCPAANRTCLQCGKVGHFRTMCRTKHGTKLNNEWVSQNFLF